MLKGLSQLVGSVPRDFLGFCQRMVVRLDVKLVLLCVIIFLIWPELDLVLASMFYDEAAMDFVGKRSFTLEIIYQVVAFIQVPILLGLLVGIWVYRARKKQSLKNKCVFLLCCLILGPGILVNVVLKDNSIGRARPRQIESYGGEAAFTTPFEYSGQCRKNCSFTSGHASIGYLLIALAWTSRRRWMFFVGVSAGTLLGLMRMSQGAHFLSDIIFAFWAVYGVTLLMKKVFQYRLQFNAYMDQGSAK